MCNGNIINNDNMEIIQDVSSEVDEAAIIDEETDKRLLIIEAWCNLNSIEFVMEQIDTTRSFVEYVYMLCSRFAVVFIKKYIADFRIGGKDKMVMVDFVSNNEKVVLCLTEVKKTESTQRFFMTNVGVPPEDDPEALNRFHSHLINIVKFIVIPETIIVYNNLMCACLERLRENNLTVISTFNLAEIGIDINSISSVLEDNYKLVNPSSEGNEIVSDITTRIVSQMWKLRFGEEAMNVMCNQFERVFSIIS